MIHLCVIHFHLFSDEVVLTDLISREPGAQGLSSNHPVHPITLERVNPGPQQRLPGPWAAHVKKLNYPATKQGDELKTDTLVILNRKPAQRELMVRSVLNSTPATLESEISESPTNIEAALGYIVGSPADPPCSCCERELGPFPHCIRVTDCHDMTACVNCHWNGNGVFCDKYYEPSAEEAPAAHELALVQRLQEAYKHLRQDFASIQASIRSASAEVRKLSDLEYNLAIAFLTKDTARMISESQVVRNKTTCLTAILDGMKEQLEHFGAKQAATQQEVTRLALNSLKTKR